MSVKLLTEHPLEFLCLKGGCIGSSESTLVKIPHCWKSHVPAQLFTIALAMVIYVSKLPLGACSIQACSISQLRNGSGVNSPAAVSFLPFFLKLPVDQATSKIIPLMHEEC